jgi:hypothetical protein
MTTKGQRNSVAKQNTLTLCVYGGGSSMVERSFCKARGESSNPSRRPNFSAPLTALTASRAYLGLAPKAGLVPTVILLLLPEESNNQNDVPQLPYRMPQIR